MSDALERLIKKTRPFKTFTLEIAGQEPETFQVRRTNVADNERISKVYTETYEDTIQRLQTDGTTDFAVLRRGLMRQTTEDLAKYLAAAVRNDIKDDVLDTYDGIDKENWEKDPRAEAIQAEIDKQVQDYQVEMMKKSREELMDMALDKREHFLALLEANKVRMQTIAALTIYTIEGEPLFKDPAAVQLLDDATLDLMVTKATEALTEEDKDLNPLKSVPSQASDVQ